MKSLLSVLKGNPLSVALAQAESAVRNAPSDADKRAEWVQLLLLYGDWLGADAQLQAWQALAPLSTPTTTQLAEALEAEIQRDLVLRGESEPAYVTPPPDWLTDLAESLRAAPQRANTLRDRAFTQAPESAGTLTLKGDGGEEKSAAFSWLADADSRLGPVCELFLDNRYCWVPFQELASVAFQPPQNVVHLIWAQAMVTWRNGKQKVCQIPARYPVTEGTDDAHRLGRKTDWLPLNDNGHYTGQGQKTWITDEDEHALLTLRRVTFTAVGE
ncbi:type VI secretion system accessory protein TagJ [Enterobacillus tribolii]|uniref:Type VI secretion system protein ImpE n=1 Tax=Enterobacillus tribolii TaxID=1487935 RepID=A0A370QSF0_9GAMM|nr:type VI secretion system accessory protein TagJ [Enterobacillus tribolii]MBW7983737.1 protein of avirulence locus ImpE [Enterobacillus tribolii]RDK92101.1 type VI secretion system protein ImpE [Enterobacillus tribolii]